MIPVLGAVLVVGFCTSQSLVGRLLAARPLVWLGLLSYSLYLWHFPVFAFSRMVSPNAGNQEKLEWMALTFTLSVISYFLVERPFRKESLVPKKQLWLSISCCVFVIAAFSIAVVLSDGLWLRYTPEEKEILKLVDQREYRNFSLPDGSKGVDAFSGEPVLSCNMRTVETSCSYGNEHIVFLGDSYIGTLQRAFIDSFEAYKTGFVSFNFEQCPFIRDSQWYINVLRCARVNKDRETVIEKMTGSRLFILAANADQFEISDGNRRYLPQMTDSEWQLYKVDQYRLAWASYNEGVSWLLSKGHKVVVVTRPPRSKLNSLKWLPNNLSYVTGGRFPAIANDTDPFQFMRSERMMYENLDRIMLVEPARFFCNASETSIENAKCLDVDPKRGPLYNGESHISYNGARLIADGIREALYSRGWLTK